MRTQGVLVHLPAYPFCLDTLSPDRELAAVATLLEDADCSCQILDQGTIGAYDRLFTDEIRDGLHDLADDYFSAPRTPVSTARFRKAKLDSSCRLIAERGELLSRQAAFEIVTQGRQAFILIKVTCEGELRNASAFARQLRELSPSTALAAFGLYFDEVPLRHAEESAAFDWILSRGKCLPTKGGASRGLPRCRVMTKAAEHLHNVQGLLPCDPGYSEERYAAMKGKINVFDVVEGVESTVAPVAPWTDESRRQKRESPAREVFHLHDACGARGFHVVGGTAASLSQQALAYDILSQRLHLRYSRETCVETMSIAALRLAKASGCCALAFRVDTGSQRLLEDYYRHAFCVSDVERLCRAVHLSEIFTAMQLTYPCAEDDRHTRAETLRLIARSKPDSVLLALEREAVAEGDGPCRSHFKPRVLLGPPPASMAATEAARVEQDGLRRDIEGTGLLTAVPPKTALMANLAGFARNEREFVEESQYQFLIGDIDGIASTVERINMGLRELSKEESRVAAMQNAVGN